MTFDIGTVSFDTKQRLLQKGELKRHLEPKVFDLLLVLVEAEGALVTREQLIDSVWKGRVVGEGAINRTVSLLRAHFSALTEQEIVETVPTQGYRLQISVSKPQPDQMANAQPQVHSANRRKPLLIGGILSALLFVISLWFLSATQEKTASLQQEGGPIIALNGWEYLLSTSDDGQRILFHHLDKQQNVVLYDVQTHQQRVILQNALAAISPDGRRVVHVQYQDECLVSVMDVENTESEPLFNCEQMPSAIGWGDDNLIYFNKRFSKSHPYQIFSYHLKTGRVQQISNPDSDNNTRGDFGFAINPVSGELAVLRYMDEDKTQLVVYQGQTEVQRWNIKKGLKNIVWHPNNRDLILAERSVIYHFSRQTNETTELQRLNSMINSLAVINDGDGTSLLVSNSLVRSDAMVFDLEGKHHQVWQQSGGIEQLPRYEAETQLLLSTRYKSHHWWQMDTDEPSIVAVELPFDLSFLRYELSADGKRVLFTKLGALYELNLAEQRYQKLFDEHNQAYVANYDATDNNHIIFSSNQDGQWQLWQFDRVTKEQTQLTSAGGYSGRMWQGNLYYSKFAADGLWVKQPGSDSETLLIKDFDRINWLNWQIRSDNLYFYRPESGVWRYNLTSQQLSLAMQVPENFIHQYTVSPDQKTLYWIRRLPVQGDIYRYAFQ